MKSSWLQIERGFSHAIYVSEVGHGRSASAWEKEEHKKGDSITVYHHMYVTIVILANWLSWINESNTVRYLTTQMPPIYVGGLDFPHLNYLVSCFYYVISF